MIKFIGAYVRIKTALASVEVLSKGSSLKFFKEIDNGFIAISNDSRTCLYDGLQTHHVNESISSRNVESTLMEFENVAKYELTRLREELGVQNVIVDFGYLSK